MNKKLLTAEGFAKAVKFVTEMLETEAQEWNSDALLYDGVCGWSGPMAPRTRLAFLATFGKEQTEAVENAAKDALKAKRDRRANSQIVKHIAEAEANEAVNAADLKVGAFVKVVYTGLKFDHENINEAIRDLIEGTETDKNPKREYESVHKGIAKITRIEERPAGFFDNPNCLNGWRAQGNEGGTATDDFDTINWSTITKEQRETLYTLAVLIREPSGRCVLIDPSGQPYPRYILFRTDWRGGLFAPICDGIEAEIKAARDAAAKAKAEKEAASRAAYDAECAKWAGHMKPVTGDWREDRKILKANLLTMAKIAAPGVRFTLRRDDGWGRGYVLSWTNGPTAEELKAKAAFHLFVTGHDTFDGMTDCAGFEKAKYTDFAKRYGGFDNGVEMNRTEAETDRNRKPPTGGDTPGGNGGTEGKTADVQAVDGVTVTENTEKNGIEIRFPAKPSDEVLTSLKAAHWRYHKAKRMWYTRATPEAREFAARLAAA